MTSTNNLFPQFLERRIKTDGAEIYLRTGGSGPPLLLLHGYPQTHACWHKLVPELAQHFTLVVPDLRGYGDSRGPGAEAGPEAYTKRAMASDCVAVMKSLGHDRWSVVSHDRGARVGYRMALDHPERVHRLAVLDIVTTLDAWTDLTKENAIGRFHWAFLARPAPFPETMIGHDPIFFVDYLLAQWTRSKDLSAFDPRALALYRHHFCKPSVIAATCADYRAGADLDPALDAIDLEAGRKITAPTLSLWGTERKHGFVNEPLESWRPWCPNVRGEPIDCGHFLAEEAPEATIQALLPFLLEDRTN